MKIIVINREILEKIPPLMSVILLLNELGNDVTVVTTGISNDNKILFERKGIKVNVIPYKISSSVIEKVNNVYSYRKKLKKIIKENQFDFLWIEGAGTFRTARGIFDKHSFILQISELYDYPEAKPIRNAISKVISKAKLVVMPEIHRAEFYKSEYALTDVPMVLPNKPYFLLTKEKFEECKEKYAKELKLFNEKKVILYQGIIAKERDLSNYIKAVNELGDEYQLVLLGSDHGMLQHYKEIDPNLIHIDFIPAPDYLVFTAHAYIGILTYDGSTLNCAYCAPNKIYEYGKYGLPMLGNNIPGLIGTIGQFNAGVIVDEKSVDDIKNSILSIDKKYESYSENAYRLFEDTDNLETMKQILSKVKEKL